MPGITKFRSLVRDTLKAAVGAATKDSLNITYQLRSFHVNFEQVDRVHSEVGYRP